MSQHSDLARKEFCSLQYSGVVSLEELSLDDGHAFLNCMPLKCDRTPGEPGRLSATKEYGIVPCDSNRRQVHVVSADKGYTLSTDCVIRYQQLLRLSEREFWTSELFYLNRFDDPSGYVYHVLQ